MNEEAAHAEEEDRGGFGDFNPKVLCVDFCVIATGVGPVLRDIDSVTVDCG